MMVPTLAQEGPPPMPELDGDIIVTGLNGPQGVYVDSAGHLWIIDSGAGGDEEIEFVDPTTFEVIPASFGNSSVIMQMAPGEEAEVVATLPSVAVGQDFLGGARLVELDGAVYATVGVWQINLGEEASLPLQAQVVRLEDGEAVTVADLWAHELAFNPDETDNLESHPYGIAAGPDGMLYVADAAMNALVRVDPESGDVETVAVFEGMPGVFPNPFRDGELIRDPVPTGVAFDADDNLYVSLLSGAPFMPGTASVMSVSADGEVSEFATGMTMLTDLTYGPDGNLYAVQFGMFTEEGPVANSGSVVRILPDGSVEVVIDGLPFATGIALDDDGNGYVTINGIAIPEAGMVVYYEGLTTREGQPLGDAE
ncbi:MAG: ScyD/ScyE family protein [Phototrophicaceae bacterium]